LHILYLAQRSLLSQHFVPGWRSAYEAAGDRLTVVDYTREGWTKVFDNAQFDLVMGASNEGILDLDPSRLNESGTRLVVNALPANPFSASFEWQTPCADPREIRHVAKFERKLVWAPQSPAYVRAFYSDWEAAGVPILSLAYGAAVPFALPAAPPEPICDIIFIGNLRHRRRGNIELFRHLFALTTPERVCVHGDAAWQRIFRIAASPTPPGFDLLAAYRSAAIAPNVHTIRQRRHGTQLNDRAFQIAAFGATQICDNPLITHAFASDEVAFASTVGAFVAIARDLLNDPQRRHEMGSRAHARALRDHHWLNRVAAVYRALGIERNIVVDGRAFAAVTGTPDDARAQIGFDRWLFYTLEGNAVRLARRIKRLALG
jgi:hypothetical protein